MRGRWQGAVKARFAEFVGDVAALARQTQNADLLVELLVPHSIRACTWLCLSAFLHAAMAASCTARGERVCSRHVLGADVRGGCRRACACRGGRWLSEDEMPETE